MSENVTINLNEPKENITISLVDQGEEITIKLNEQARGPSVVVDNAVVNAAIAEDPQATRDALEIPIDNFTATNEPTVSDDSSEGYQKGSRWYDTVAEEAYICVDASVGAAIWIKTTLTVDELGSAAFLDATTDGAANPEEVLKTDANGDVTVHNINVGSVLFDTANGTPDTLGELGWDSEDETLAFVMKSGEVLQIGEETLYHIENNTVSTIAKGTPVMYAGTIGASGKLRGKPWDGTTPKAFLGIASAQILGNGETGYVTQFGKVKGIQTNGANYGETWISGDIIYAVSGSSNLTKVQPSAGGYVVVAVVIAAHASNGTLFVRPTEVPSLTDIGAAATLHTHGNITSDGRIGSTATLPIITTTGGTLTTGAFGTTAGTFAQGNDARLSDERVPTAAGIASKINGATAKTTLVDADETVLTDSAASFGLKKVTWLNVWNYIVTKIGAITSITASGAWSFSSTTRPTSGGTGTPAATSLITAADRRTEEVSDLSNVYYRQIMGHELGVWATVGSSPNSVIDGDNRVGCRFIGCGTQGNVSAQGGGIKYPDGGITGGATFAFNRVFDLRFVFRNHFNISPLDVAYFLSLRNNSNFWSASSIGLYHVAQPTATWSASTAYTAGNRIEVSGIVYVCSTSGTSGASQPIFNATINGTTNDNTAVWRTLGPHTSDKWALAFVDGSSNITLTDTGVAWVTGATNTTSLRIRSNGSSVFASVNGSSEVSVSRGSLTQATPYIMCKGESAGITRFAGLIWTVESSIS